MKKLLKLLLLFLFAIIIYQSFIFIKEYPGSADLVDYEINTETLPTELHPIVAEKVEILKEKTLEKKITILITDDYRSFEEQDKLYDKGRKTPGKVVTYMEGGESYHNFGLAVDFALQLENGNVIWDTEYDGNGNGQSDWFEVAEIAKELGFQWGGDWSGFKDYPHLQMDFGLTINDLQKGKRPKYPS
ncbi:M15 family metallopeptidase [Bacillus sp. 03113]|uniref:M15 family metallopeptidase n=1 Tax=Bacillus sp. 03113 TaxID=2578211 RepID=UPI00114375B4|nr:M15 family metallopeptidase [Bacillus sp. 03113]